MDYNYLANIVHVAASGNSLEEINPWKARNIIVSRILITEKLQILNCIVVIANKRHIILYVRETFTVTIKQQAREIAWNIGNMFHSKRVTSNNPFKSFYISLIYTVRVYETLNKLVSPEVTSICEDKKVYSRKPQTNR